MRYTLAAALILCASGACAGPFDFLGGIPDAPGVVRGGSFGPTGNDYYGPAHGSGIGHDGRAARHARPRLRQSASGPLPRS